MHNASSTKSEDAPSKDEANHVVIVGCGFAGLACAKELLSFARKNGRKIKVTILEADNDIGGRAKGHKTFLSPGQTLDLGAEFIHCQGHVLWDWVFEFFGPQETEDEARKVYVQTQFESIFLLSHADGGPAEEPTKDGKYGMYYMDNELIMYNDPRLDPLNEILDSLGCQEPNHFGVQDSLADALRKKPSSKSPTIENAISDSL